MGSLNVVSFFEGLCHRTQKQHGPCCLIIRLYLPFYEQRGCLANLNGFNVQVGGCKLQARNSDSPGPSSVSLIWAWAQILQH